MAIIIDKGRKRVSNDRPGSTPVEKKKSQQVCYQWRGGRCNRNPCPYRHSEVPESMTTANNGVSSSKRSHENFPGSHPPLPLRRNKWNREDNGGGRGGGGECKVTHDPKLSCSNPSIKVCSNQVNPSIKVCSNQVNPRKNQVKEECEIRVCNDLVQNKVCKYWVEGKCSFGERCKYQHQWFTGKSFTFLTELQGHQKAISGIAFPLDSDKLFSTSKDESIRVWDCNTGQCSSVVNPGGEIGCVISYGTWVFVGISNAVKGWNSKTNINLSFSSGSSISAGQQVYALDVSYNDEMLLAGMKDGSILVWRLTATEASTDGFELAVAACVTGHSSAVVSLVSGASNMLYSGSMDHTIRAWDLDTMQCIHIVKEHTSSVMSVLCWKEYLLSCSLDRTIKVWAKTEEGNLEVVYTHKEEHGVLTLCGIHDKEASPVLMCGCNDNTVRFYDLPSFEERGMIFSKKEIRVIKNGPGGLFFTGDGNGELKVWKWCDN